MTDYVTPYERTTFPHRWIVAIGRRVNRLRAFLGSVPEW